MGLIIVLADDFSGATEMAGIGHEFGLNTMIYTSFDAKDRLDNQVELLVLDTDTRNLKPDVAREKYKSILQELSKITLSPLVFKKVDSVLRGNILTEINVIRDIFNFNRFMLLPANPSKNRIIQDGKYQISGVPLHETSFGDDPHFPISTNEILIMLNANQHQMKHQHLLPGDEIPTSGLITVDQTDKKDIELLIHQSNPSDLICGGADCFEVFLNHLGYKKSTTLNQGTQSKYRVIINGSTIENQEEFSILDKMGIKDFSLPKPISNDQLDHWKEEISIHLQNENSVALHIGKPYLEEKANEYLNAFIAIIHPLLNVIKKESAHFYLTGGATSRKVIEELSINELKVIKQQSPGVVTVNSRTYPHYFFTVKPGSYPWGIQDF